MNLAGTIHRGLFFGWNVDSSPFETGNRSRAMQAEARRATKGQ
jgi:hypothetical protein